MPYKAVLSVGTLQINDVQEKKRRLFERVEIFQKLTRQK